ncbi:MAG: enoyl-CoA hydratase/isomerase family protein [Acidimicrobiales bacterium]
MAGEAAGTGGPAVGPPGGGVATAMAGGVAVLTLSGDKVNALDVATLEELRSCVARCKDDADVTAVVLTGQGTVFSAGLNVRELLGNEPGYADTVLDALEAVLVQLLRCPKPTVAAINGAAIAGGCLLACACDLRVVAESARLGVTELQVGVAFPVLTVELLRHVCGARAEQVLLEAALLTADEACAAGLAHRQAPADEVLAVAVAGAERLASGDRRAYALAKEASRRPVLEAAASEGARRLDRSVRDHWRSGETRASLGRLLER